MDFGKNNIKRFFDKVFEIELRIAMLAVLIMMLVVVADVFSRHVLNAPLAGAYDMVEICLVVMVFFGFARVVADKTEILIDLIDSCVPVIYVRTLSIIAGLTTAIVLFLLFYSMVGSTISAYNYGDRSLELNIPQWIVWVLSLIGLSGAIIAAIGSIFTFNIASVDSPSAGEGEASE